MTTSYQPSVRALAQAGDLKAIAYWLNGFLAPQGIQVRVGRSRAGLHLLIEFHKQPNRDRLVRFVCNRLCQLRSNLIGKVCIVARPIGSRKIVWAQSVRLSGRSHRAPDTVSRASGAGSRVKPPTLQSTPATPTSAIVLRQNPSFTIAQRNRRRRAIVLGGSAAAAFVVGGGFELMQHYSASTAGRNGTRSDVTTVNDRVSVTEQPSQNPLDPTVTLSFSSDLIAPRAAASAFNDMRSDISLANLDAPQPDSDGLLSPDQVDADRVDLVNLASDRLKGGSIERTIEQLNAAGIGSIGAGRNQREARRPQILEVKGQRIAYLGYADSDLRAAGSWNAGLNPGIDRRIREDIQAIRPQVDWVVVNYCWNQDLAEYPDDAQVKLARFAIDEGADLVVGHHPNVLQGAEIYQGRAIAYSIGNFVFADSQANPETDYDTAVLKVSLRESDSGDTKQMRVEFVPIQVRQSQPAIAVGENARRITQYLRQASGLFEKPLQSPTILDLRSPDASIEPPAIEIPSANPVPTAPPESPTAPASSSDSFIAPADAPLDVAPPDVAPSNVAPSDATPAQPNSFTSDPPPTPRTQEIRQDEVQPPAAQTADDRHLTPPSAEPTHYEAPVEPIAPIEPAPMSPKPIPIETTIDSVASLPDAPKPAIESPKPIEAALAPAPASTEITSASAAAVSVESAEPEAN